MENKYLLLINLEKQTKKIYEEKFNKENYSFLINKDNIILVKKEVIKNEEKTKEKRKEDIKNNNEEIIVKYIESISRKYNNYGFLCIDLTNEINSILKDLEKDGKIRVADQRITWRIRQAMLKAIVDKEKNKNKV